MDEMKTLTLAHLTSFPKMSPVHAHRDLGTVVGGEPRTTVSAVDSSQRTGQFRDWTERTADSTHKAHHMWSGSPAHEART